MTTPTPAQIEAARKAYWDCHPNEDCLVAALTAAAEVVEPLYRSRIDPKTDPETHRIWRAINGYDIDDLDKRAEAFMYSTLDGLHVGPGNRATVKSALAENFEELEKDTLERCAQMVEESFTPFSLESLAAAIRALKDK